jgi:hypothetical protein
MYLVEQISFKTAWVTWDIISFYYIVQSTINISPELMNLMGALKADAIFKVHDLCNLL